MSRKTVLVSRRKYLVPRSELFVSRKTVLVSGGNIWFPKGSYLCLQGQYSFPKGNIWFPKGSYSCLQRQYWFPEGNISLPEGSQIRIRVREMMDQFEVFCCPNRSNMSTQRSQTSGFSVGFSGGNSEQTVKQPIEVFSGKHRAHCLKAMPG